MIDGCTLSGQTLPVVAHDLNSATVASSTPPLLVVVALTNVPVPND